MAIPPRSIAAPAVLAAIAFHIAACRGDTPPVSNDAARVGQAGASGARAFCPTGRGPAMVRLEAPNGARYCIDSTEVTQQQYAAFLSDGPPDPAAQGRETCRAANPSFAPAPDGDSTQPGCPEGTFDPKAHPDSPMPCVDFCDALAFCEWSGKQLCGSVTGGPIGLDEPRSNDAWYLACSQGGRTKFSVGDTVSPEQCKVGQEQIGQLPSATGSCRGESPPWSDVLDLTGSLSEWQDACDDRGMCRLRGGSVATLDPEGMECAGDFVAPIGHHTGSSRAAGIRCCAPLAGAP